MEHFLVRLKPPRASFPWDMSPAEAGLMTEHAAYLRGLVAKGTVVLAGPVLDRNDPWGLAIVEAADEASARSIVAEDPTVKAGLNQADVLPMRLSMIRKGASTPA